MAERFGGKYSPDGAKQAGEPPAQRGVFDGARVEPVGLRANLLFVPGALLAILSLGGGAINLAAGLTGAAVLTLAAWLLRGGLRAEAEYASRKVARAPALPRKMASSLLTGIGIAIAAWTNEPGVVAPLLYGLVAGALHVTAFGVDPLKSKGMEGIDTFQQDRVARAVGEAEGYLSAMSDAVKRANDRRIEARVERFQATVRDLFRTVEEDPRDLTGARKYLTVYLMGARDATVKFADIYSRGRDPQALADYQALLDDLEQNFAARTKRMLLDDRTDLTVEIDVLRERLQREGVRPR